MAQKNHLKINFFGEISSKDKLACETTLFDCAARFNLTNSVEVEIMVVDKEKIAELNAKHRNKNQPTDVLSFPQSPFQTEHNILGSIVICTEVVAEKDEELTDVIKHGFLHLLGFDHETEDEKWQEAAKKIDCKL